MKLSTRLILVFLLVGLIPALTLGVVSVYKASSSLSEQSFQQLEAVREIKKSQIESFFRERESDLAILAETISAMYRTTDHLNQVSAFLAAPASGERASFFEKYIEAYDYYDLFLINPLGDIYYSVAKESDYKTNLLQGPYKNSGLGDLFRKVIRTGEYALQDFTPYSPSNGEPAAFIAQPVYIGDELITVVALQLSIDKINAIMQLRDGMGESGESYLVGSDGRMRSDSFLDPSGHSVKASFAGPLAVNGVDTQAVREAVAGRADTDIILDYNGNPVLSAYTPVTVGETVWALIAELDEAEAFQAVDRLEHFIAVLALMVVICVVVIAVVVARMVTRPLGGEPKEMKQIAEKIANGDLTLTFKEQGEEDSVYQAMHRMSVNLRGLVHQIMLSSTEIARASEETSVVTRQTSRNVQLQQQETAQVSAAVSEMSASGQQIVASTMEATKAVNEASGEADVVKDVIYQTTRSIRGLSDDIHQSMQVIRTLEEHTEHIGSVLDVIRGIAEQTNLLALNAAIEAARAGEQGRGFAVVADEVRSLAQKTQDSTSNIEDMINRLQSSANTAVGSMTRSMTNTEHTISDTEKAVAAMDKIRHFVENICTMNIQIASATEQQNIAVEEISRNIVSINQVALETSGGAQQTAEATLELARLSERLRETVDGFRV